MIYYHLIPQAGTIRTCRTTDVYGLEDGPLGRLAGGGGTKGH